ncbi:MAG: LysM peptidoglycan-binding domain-containing protein [Verrucomicrobiota bacterium]
MKPNTLPVKRRPVTKGIFKRLSAVTGSRKQRVAATAEMDAEDNSSKISRALTIVFLIHIVAIGLIFVHQKFLDGRRPDGSQEKVEKKADVIAKGATPTSSDLPRLAAGENSVAVRAGDNYTRIAAAEGVDEKDLRAINQNVEIRSGMNLKIPPKRIVAVDPPEVAAIRQQTPPDKDRGLVEAVPVDVSGAPRAQLVSPKRSATRAAAMEIAPVPAVAGTKNYTTQPGDSIWRISNRFKVSQDVLMKANGISDARKIKAGMSLIIPR